MSAAARHAECLAPAIASEERVTEKPREQPTFRVADGSVTEAPSSRPTTIPHADQALGVMEMVLRGCSDSAGPLDIGIPTRTPAAQRANIDHRLAFILLHVDGVSSVGEIAGHLELPPTEVRRVFLELLGLELIALSSPPLDREGCTKSGVFPRCQLSRPRNADSFEDESDWSSK